MRISFGAMLGSAIVVAAWSYASASPLIRSDSATTQSSVADGVVLIHDTAPRWKRCWYRGGRYYCAVRGQHRGWYMHDRGQRYQSRCMIEPWLCRPREQPRCMIEPWLCR
jgi:hypothetical protein